MTLKQVLKKAQKEKWAIGQFNFSTLEQLRGILAAAEKLRSPVILGTSEGELSYFGLEEAIALVEISKKRGAKLLEEELSSSFLNLDHGKDLDLIKKAIDLGYSYVHFDGSDLSLEENIKYAKKVVDYSHKKGVLVEGEIDPIEKEKLTSPARAEKFVKETGIDCLAIAIGNVHGLPRKIAKLNFQGLKEISQKTKAFLVLHGGSGIPDEEIKKAIKLGIVKININTELRLVWQRTLRTLLKTGEIKPYKILQKVESAIQGKVEEKINLFGSYEK